MFQTLHSTGQSSMVRDWVMLSLSNFTQRAPVAMAVWSLSCFFVSASTNPWVSAAYPSRGPGLGWGSGPAQAPGGEAAFTLSPKGVKC